MESDLIYDIGLHIGQDTEFYLKKGFRVVAIEANPLLVDAARQKFVGEIAADRLRVVPVGIANVNGRLPFYVNETYSEWSSFDREIGARLDKYHTINVEVTTLENIIEVYSVPYYMKVDIEGYDCYALESLDKLNERPKYVSVENGQLPLLYKMIELGYSSFKFINQATVQNINLPNPAKEGIYIDHIFPHGSSGPFGEETQGDWLSAREVTELIRGYWEDPNRDPNIHGWYDLHAKFA